MYVCTYTYVRMCMHQYAQIAYVKSKCSIRNKEQVPDGQMSEHHYFGSDKFRFARTYFCPEKYTCATVDVPQQMCHSRCATADVPQ